MGFRTFPGRWKILLIASLSLNLLVVGLIAGAFLDRRDGPPAHALRGATPFIAALGPEDRRQLFRHLRNSRDVGDQKGRFRALIAALTSEPFDRDLVADLLGTQRARVADRSKRGEAALIDRLSDMSAEDRAAYAQRLERLVRRRR